jgi:hypothetical protein
MKVVCSHCGLPFSIERPARDSAVFCCSGCALAARVLPGAEGDDARPAGPLVAALTIVFVWVNQILSWLLAVLLARRAEAGAEAETSAAGLVWISIGLGAGAWLAVGLVQWRLGARRVADGLVVACGAGMLASAVWTASPACALAASTAQAAWALRGLGRKKNAGSA